MGLSPTKVHFYADDTVLYTSASSLQEAVNYLQSAFNQIQNSVVGLRLVLNAKKTKFMVFTRSHTPCNSSITTITGTQLEKVSSYKYLGIWLERNSDLN